MGLTVGHVARAIERIGLQTHALEQELNEADARLGDGDTGRMLKRVLDSMSAVDLSAASTPAEALTLLARAASVTGSSFGTLLIVGLNSAAKAAGNERELEWQRIADVLFAARDSLLSRGGARIGDKTMVDIVDALAKALNEMSDPTAMQKSATAAVHEALERFRPLQCRVGRARIFGERSMGVDDPGMLALVRITDAVCVAGPGS
jgi:dihydroxyacetone kinase